MQECRGLTPDSAADIDIYLQQFEVAPRQCVTIFHRHVLFVQLNS